MGFYSGFVFLSEYVRSCLKVRTHAHKDAYTSFSMRTHVDIENAKSLF